MWPICCQVNSKATLMFSGMINDEVHENIFWPDLPYLIDEHGSELVLVLLYSCLVILDELNLVICS